MKKILVLFTTLFFLVFGFSSCQTDENFDRLLLVGTWNSETEYYKYKIDNTGTTWDTKDNTEADAQKFTWELVSSQLTQIHIMEMGGSVPKVYTVTNLTEKTLTYKDDFKTYTFTKIIE